jgi:ATP-binding cassette, subfamily C (CFTR/MRP), member 4
MCATATSHSRHIHIHSRCIKGYLRDKICVLVTHQIQYLQDAKRIVVLENVGQSAGTNNEINQC